MMHDNDKKTREFKTPVSWLMGRELLAGLKWIAGYLFMGDKQNHKDWMNPSVIKAPRSNNNSSDPYWFDYIADTGDGMSAVYNIAYLCQSDIWLTPDGDPGPDKAALGGDENHTIQLPRGEFLFVGGDTAYHIADTASLKERFQTPFNWACQDLMHNTGKSVDKRPMYGIPANHDYYDALDGFNRQFCTPVGGDDYDPLDPNQKLPQLGLLGFERIQNASFIALKLPFDWMLWGVDCQEGKLDKRQQAFFVQTFYPDLIEHRTLYDTTQQAAVYRALRERSPKKLIVATPEPSTVFGKWAEVSVADETPPGKAEKDNIGGTFKKLGLDLSFAKEADGKLPSGKCRLDISGDIHHYERYWGGSPGETPTNYASVVAGGGGAFLHPSHTDLNQARRQALYPSRADSHQLMTRKVLNPWNIFNGGFIWLAGGVIALLTYFAITVPDSTHSLFTLFPDDKRPAPLGPGNTGLLAEMRSRLSFLNPPGFCTSEYCFDFFYYFLYLGLLAIWVWQWRRAIRPDMVNISDAAWRKSAIQFTLPTIPGLLLLFILVLISRPNPPHPFLAGLLIDLSIITAVLLFTLGRIYSDILIARARYHREKVVELIPLWLFSLLGVIFAGFGFLRYGIYSASIMTFDLLTAIVWFLATAGLVAVAAGAGATLLDMRGKLLFAVIGLCHVILQISVPVCLLLYASTAKIVVISTAAIIVTLVAGYLFTKDRWVKDFTQAQQRQTAICLSVAWVALGLAVLLSACSGTPFPVNLPRLAGVFFTGALFSCIWFGWYLAVSLAFHGHNNEAGGGARSEQFRHLIRFKLEENRLTGYVIGIDVPVKDFKAQPQPKFRLVDVFTISV
jgi:hypothetical protein